MRSAEPPDAGIAGTTEPRAEGEEASGAGDGVEEWFDDTDRKESG